MVFDLKSTRGLRLFSVVGGRAIVVVFMAVTAGVCFSTRADASESTKSRAGAQMQENCPDLAIANDLAVGSPDAVTAASKAASGGDLLARDRLLVFEVSRYIYAHGWYGPQATENTSKLGVKIEMAARAGNPNASLIYRRVLQSDYYEDLDRFSAFDARISARLAALAGKRNFYSEQLKLRGDLQRMPADSGPWMRADVALRQIIAASNGPCGMLYQDDVATAYAAGLASTGEQREALVWYGRAASAGLIHAQYAAAELMVDQLHNCDAPGVGNAFLLAQRAAFKGYVRAWVLLGEMYDEGNCVRKDPDSAEQAYEEASRRGSIVGTFLLGKMLIRHSSSPIRWSRGAILVTSVEDRVGMATPVGTGGLGASYSVRCVGQNQLSREARSYLFRVAVNFGVEMPSAQIDGPTASPDDCAVMNAAMSPPARLAQRSLVATASRLTRHS